MSRKANIKRKSNKSKKFAKAAKVTPKELEKVIVHIIAEIAEVSKKRIRPNTNFAKDLSMDSMMALEILAAIEKKYKIEIPEEYLPKMTNMKEVVKLTAKLLE